MVPYFHEHEKLRVTGAAGEVLQTQYGSLIDLNSGYWSVILGHGSKQVRSFESEGFWGDLFNFDQEPAELLADELVRMTGYAKCIFLCSGSSAVDTALRIGLSIGKENSKSEIVSLRRAYHGSTGLCLSCNGLEYGSPMGSSTVKATRIKPRYASGHLDEEVERPYSSEVDWSKVAVFIFEPIQAVGGLRKLDYEWLKPLLVDARKHGVFVVADEITSGFGRGSTFTETYGFRHLVDACILGKPLTNGEFPLASVLLSENAWERILNSELPKREKFVWGETYGGHPTGAIFGLRTLLASQTKSVQRNKSEITSVLHRHVTEILGTLPQVARVLLPSDFLAAGVVLRDSRKLRDAEIRMWRLGYRLGLESNALLFVPMFVSNPNHVVESIKALKDVLIESF